MFARFCAVLAVLGLVLSPALAAPKKKAVAKKPPAGKVAKAKAQSKTGSKAVVKKTAAKKTVSSKTEKTAKTDEEGLEPTVEFKHTVPTAATPPTPPAKPTDPAKSTTEVAKQGDEEEQPAQLTAKEQEELEKAGQKKLAKNPKAALQDFKKIISANPNYRYAGDVYMNMYQAAERTNADLLDRIQYAGKAAQALELGRSRRGVDKGLAAKYNGLTDQLINKWIDIETKKIMAGQYQ